LATFVGAVGILSAAILLWPVKHHVRGTAVLIPADSKAVYATSGGELAYAVPAGTRVRAGDVIAELRDPQLKLAVAKHSGEFAVKQAHFNQVNTLRALDSRMSLQLPTAQADLVDAKSQLAQYERREKELVLRSPVDGVVIAPPAMELKEAEDRLPTWSGSPLDSRNLGGWIKPGTVLCTVGDSKRLNALVAIDERDVGEIQPGEPMKILIDSAPVQIVTGKVKQVASRALEPRDDAEAGVKDRMHVVEVELDPSQVSAIVGSAGTAKIEASRSTLASLAVNFVKRRLKMPW
jgi:putative peptide zinc metalloprotease protein